MTWQSLVCAAALAAALAPHGTFAACTVGRYAELPVTISDGKPIVTGSINGHAARFVADTGSFYNTINRQSAEGFAMKFRTLPIELQWVYGVGGESKAYRAVASDFTLEGFGTTPRRDVDFVALTDRFGGDADGLIGANLLSRNDAEFDLAKGAIRLYTSKGCQNAWLAYWADAVSIVELETGGVAEPKLVGVATLNGRKIKLLFDTGAPRSLLSEQTATALGLKPDGEDVKPGGAAGGIGGGGFDTWIARFDTLQIGSEQVKNARIRVGKFGAKAFGIDGIIGIDFFLSHRLYASTEQQRLYITYNGGPVFDLRKPNATQANSAAADSADEPADAAGFRRRGAASAERRNYAAAIKDYDRALELDTSDAESYYLRGVARSKSDQSALAIDDFNEALRLKPDHMRAHVERGQLRLRQKDLAGADQDFAAVRNLAPKDTALALEMAVAYGEAGYPEEDLIHTSRWIVEYPRDEALPIALNNRCWIRAKLNKELDQALDDCNRALERSPRAPGFLDSRGLVYLRLGKLRDAIADYSQALKVAPTQAESRYGLGLAQIKSGKVDEGKKSIEAAIALDPHVAELFEGIGLAAPK